MVEVTRQRGWGLGVGRGSGPESSVLGEQYVPPQEGVSAFTGWSTQSNRELSLGGDRGPWGYLEDGSLDLKALGRPCKRVTRSDLHLDGHSAHL